MHSLPYLEYKLTVRENNTMLYNTPNTPVLIKKIGLKIWKIRSEIESVIEKDLSQNKKIDVKELQEKYEKITTEIKNEEGFSSDELVIDDGEDEMAKAIADAEKGEGKVVEDKDDDESNNDNDNDNDNESSTTNIIIQERPNIPKNKLINASMLLSEIYMDTVFFFLNEKLLEGQIIAMEFLVPKRFILKAEVLYCRHYTNTSRIIGKNRLPYRAYAKLLLTEEGSRSILREFLNSIAIDPATLQVADKKSSSDDDDDDDFSELDNI
jgi:hypothetical protein